MSTHKLSIPGMKCGGCVSTIENALKAVSNNITVTVDLESIQATIEGDVDANTLITAVTGSGFPAEKI